MAKKEEKAPEPEVEALGTEESAPIEVDTLKLQVGDLERKLEESQKEAKAHQGNVTRKSQEISQLKSKLSQPKAETTNETLLDLMEEQYGTDPRIEKLRQTMDYDKRLAFVKAKTDEARSDIEQKITNAGLESGSEEFDRVWDAFKIAYMDDGDFTTAHQRAERVIKSHQPESKPEDKQGEKEAEIEEKARKYLEDKGYLITETGLPQGSTGGRKPTLEEIRAASPQEFEAKTKSGEWVV